MFKCGKEKLSIFSYLLTLVFMPDAVFITNNPAAGEFFVGGGHAAHYLIRRFLIRLGCYIRRFLSIQLHKVGDFRLQIQLYTL